MKSRILGKLIVMCLLVLGMVLVLGAKAMVSANPLYYRSGPNICDLKIAAIESKLIADNNRDKSQIIDKGLTGVYIFRQKNLQDENVIEKSKDNKPMVLAIFGLVPLPF